MKWESTEKRPIVKKPLAKISELIDDLLKDFSETKKKIEAIKDEPVSNI